MSFFKRKKYPEGAAFQENDPAVNTAPSADNDTDFTEVYAGPEVMANRGQKNERPSMRLVYASPDFMRGRNKEMPLMEDVYAGPPEEPPIMCVYAGPDYWEQRQNNYGSDIGPFTSEKAGNRSNEVICSCCGARILIKTKFCPECGAPLNDEASANGDHEALL